MFKINSKNIFIINFEHISHLVLVLLLLTRCFYRRISKLTRGIESDAQVNWIKFHKDILTGDNAKIYF